jgi:cytochrome c oxidase cbb3-type subunit 3
MKRLIFIFTLLFVSNSVWAVVTPADGTTGNIYTEILLVLFLVALLLLIVSLVLLKTVRVMANEIKSPGIIPSTEPAKMLEYEEWQAAEKSGKSSKHGIKELDNPTPVWFNAMFYGSILFALVYLLNYHVLEWSPLQDEEYAIEMKAAEASKGVLLAKAGNLIDETTVKVDGDAGVLAAGKTVYMQNCVACHAPDGGGTVGPNLTDEYWIHGGTVNNIFKTIKYGIPEKGMISWEKTLTVKQTSDVSNFILSLQGTKPANPKEPQGTKM